MTETPSNLGTGGGSGDGPEGPGAGGRIEPIELQTSMQRAYIDYAMAVIVGRALPDVRDGLDRKSTRLNSSHIQKSRMPSSA